MKKIWSVFVVLILVFGIYYFTQIPSNDRDWSKDQKILSTAIIGEDQIEIKNIRNFKYQSTTDYNPDYYDAVVYLSDLERVDYILEPFGSVGAAHTFLSFGFKDGQQIAISVEIRKEIGESFSPWKGIARQYELMYVIADERDVVDLRANHRKDTVYLYPSTASPEKARELFVHMLNRANKLVVEPEFYHTVLSNCTTNIRDHINAISDQKIGFDYRLVLPEFSDVLAQELGFIAQDMTIEEARAKYKINDLAEKHQGDENFSQLIRSNW